MILVNIIRCSCLKIMPSQDIPTEGGREGGSCALFRIPTPDMEAWAEQGSLDGEGPRGCGPQGWGWRRAGWSRADPVISVLKSCWLSCRAGSRHARGNSGGQWRKSKRGRYGNMRKKQTKEYFLMGRAAPK